LLPAERRLVRGGHFKPIQAEFSAAAKAAYDHTKRPEVKAPLPGREHGLRGLKAGRGTSLGLECGFEFLLAPCRLPALELAEPVEPVGQVHTGQRRRPATLQETDELPFRSVAAGAPGKLSALPRLVELEQEFAELGEAFRAELLRPGGLDFADGFADDADRGRAAWGEGDPLGA
jgi:hypothetical protein